MEKILLRKDHITFSSADDINQICKPLEKIGVTSFNFVRTYDDGSQINLSNTPLWLEYFYDSGFYKIGEFEKHPQNYESGFSLWPQLSGQRIFYDARHYFNIDNGITVIEKQIDSCDFFYFGSERENKGIINTYLNNLDLLKKFISYFREKASPLIRKAVASKIIIPNHFENNGRDFFTKKDVEWRQEFLKDIPIKKYFLNGELAGMTLTHNQLMCVLHMFEGKSAKEIAKIRGVSFRTIEGLINKLKKKFECETKSELLTKLARNVLDFHISNI